MLHQGSTCGSDFGLAVAHLALLRLGLHNQVIFPDLLFWGTRRLLLLLQVESGLVTNSIIIC